MTPSIVQCMPNPSPGPVTFFPVTSIERIDRPSGLPMAAESQVAGIAQEFFEVNYSTSTSTVPYQCPLSLFACVDGDTAIYSYCTRTSHSGKSFKGLSNEH